MTTFRRPSFTPEEALAFHAQGKPGKLEITPTKPMATARDLSLAYSPGVAIPVLAIAETNSNAPAQRPWFRDGGIDAARIGGLGHRAGMPPADATLYRPASLGQRQPNATVVPVVGDAVHEPPGGQPVHHPRQGRLAEQDVPVQLADADRLGALGQRVQHVVLPHGDIGPDVLGGELLHERGVGGQQRLPRIVGVIAHSASLSLSW